jgi:hypothetical protein
VKTTPPILAPAAAPDPNILPVRINYLRTRDFQKAREKSDRVARVAFNEGCLFAKRLKDFAEEIHRAFEPKPSECRAASRFDRMIDNHVHAMKHFAESVDWSANAFVEQCNALENLAGILILSDKGTEYDSVKKFSVRMRDGTGVIFPRQSLDVS